VAAGPIALVADPRLLEKFLSGLGQPDSSALGMGWPDEADAGLARDRTEAGRRKVCRLLTTAVSEAMPQYAAAQRLALLSTVLVAVQSGTWNGPLGEQGWIRVVSEALENLDRDDIPGRLSASVASWAALATYLMHDHRPTSGRPAEGRWYEQAARAVSHLFPDADLRLVAEYSRPFTNKSGFAVDPEAVLHVIEIVVQDDPLALVIDELEAAHPGWRAHKHMGAVLHFDGRFSNMFVPAAEALDAITGTARTVAVWATGAAAGWMIVIRHDGTLIQVEKDPRGQAAWRQYRLDSLTSPTGIARDPERRNRARINHGRQDTPFTEALAALAAVGIDLSADPSSQCPPGESFTYPAGGPS
jgi:hypothetical protein